MLLLLAPSLGKLQTAVWNMPSLSFAPLGLCAALLTVRRPLARWASAGALVLALVPLCMQMTWVQDRLLGRHLTSTMPLVWLDRSLHLAHRVILRGRGYHLQVSPSGQTFAIRRSERESTDFLVGRFSGEQSVITAEALQFLDDDRLVVLQRLPKGLQLRLADLTGTSISAWRIALPPIEKAQLALSRDATTWSVLGTEADFTTFVGVFGHFDSVATDMHRWPVDLAKEDRASPLYAVSATLALQVISRITVRSGVPWLPGKSSRSSVLWRYDASGAQKIATWPFPVQCLMAPLQDGALVCYGRFFEKRITA